MRGSSIVLATAALAHAVPAARLGDQALRKLRMTASEIAEVLSLALSTVSLWLKRIGLGSAPV